MVAKGEELFPSMKAARSEKKQIKQKTGADRSMDSSPIMQSRRIVRSQLTASGGWFTQSPPASKFSIKSAKGKQSRKQE